ncbi:multiheme c-type cytochrome [Solimonas sp. K1W22B-7]|uniref:multiheme c-type cytochrome n=1 Tax=Solimonas sp. K1W22B-7 TaxID=2303331 RepID=UPI0013C4413F|nr:multiheme c-type cytochrome [Solimonas sp. K1W22B-7]
MRRQLLAVSLAVVLSALLPAAAAPAPDRNLGVADCAGSTCHGSIRPFADRQIRQDEYFVWQRKDAHGSAWKTLFTERARRITGQLGWAAPHEAQGCLVCHAHVPPAEARGPRFQNEDGIACEACHGASERWIAEHVNSLKTPEEKRAHGMTATWDARVRGQLCTSCHLGDTSHPMTHAIMAAGHPPLLFELDTFTALMPPHWDVDADYRKRKPVADTASNWLEGQIAATDAWLARLESGALGHGLFPELALFDCDACHHSMNANRWHAGRAPGLSPGQVPLADQPLVLVQAWAGVMSPGLADVMTVQRERLYKQYETDASRLRAQAGELRGWLQREAWGRLRQGSPDAAQLRQVLRRVAQNAESAQGGDFYYAQQTAMAAQVLAAAIGERGGNAAALKGATDALYDSVKNRDRFQPEEYRGALGKLSAAVR